MFTAEVSKATSRRENPALLLIRWRSEEKKPEVILGWGQKDIW